MWHAGREAFMFWTLVAAGVFIAVALIVKSAITYVLQKRAAAKQDEHATHLGIG